MGAEGKDSGRFEPIDLSSLESLDIEPAWAKKSSPPNYEQKGTSHRLEGRKPGRNEKNPAQRKGSRYPPRQKAENQFTFSIQPKGEVLQKIKEEMTKDFNSKINLSYKIDESLLAGVKIKIGSIMIDNSLKNKLTKMKNSMKEV